MSENETEKSKLDLLKEEANAMGLEFHPTIGEDKLRKKVNAFKLANPDAGKPPAEENETLGKTTKH